MTTQQNNGSTQTYYLCMQCSETTIFNCTETILPQITKPRTKSAKVKHRIVLNSICLSYLFQALCDYNQEKSFYMKVFSNVYFRILKSFKKACLVHGLSATLATKPASRILNDFGLKCVTKTRVPGVPYALLDEVNKRSDTLVSMKCLVSIMWIKTRYKKQKF